MWPGSDSGSALAQDGSLGVTKGTVLVQASPLRAIKRMGDKQRSLLNRAAKRGIKGQSRQRARGARPNRVRAVNRTSGVSGSSASRGPVGNTYGEVTLQGLGNHEYLRLAGRLSGQRCESIEGGVIVRRGC